MASVQDPPMEMDSNRQGTPPMISVFTHHFFNEPTESPSLALSIASGGEPVTVADVGIMKTNNEQVEGQPNPPQPQKRRSTMGNQPGSRIQLRKESAAHETRPRKSTIGSTSKGALPMDGARGHENQPRLHTRSGARGSVPQPLQSGPHDPSSTRPPGYVPKAQKEGRPPRKPEDGNKQVVVVEKKEEPKEIEFDLKLGEPSYYNVEEPPEGCFRLDVYIAGTLFVLFAAIIRSNGIALD